MTRRALLPLAALAALLLASAPASASGGPRGFAVQIPSPGHVTVAELALAVRSSTPRRLPRRVWIGARGTRTLPPSVRALVTTRAIRIRGGYRYAALVLIVRKAPAAGAAQAADAEHGPNALDLIFSGGQSSWAVCVDCHSEMPSFQLERGLCDSCMFAHQQRLHFQAAARKDADRARKRTLRTLNDLFRRDFTEAGDPEPVFGALGDGRSDPHLDTGHYDDGHAFGWGTPKGPSLPPRDVARVDVDLVEDLRQDPPRLVTDLEVATNVDLNGDGAIGPRQRIDTRVGPIVVS